MLPGLVGTGFFGTGGVAALSTRWRLYFPSGASVSAANTAVGIIECEMRATAGGADQCSGGTASASSTFDGTTPASEAFDNDTTGTSRWQSSTGAGIGAWLEYTFASAVSVNQIVITAGISDGPTSIWLQYYDGSTWVTYLADDGPLNWSTATQTFTYSAPYVAPTGYTQWRIYFDLGATGSVIQLDDVEMRATSGGADRCFGGTATASGSFSGSFLPDKAFDNSTGNDWASPAVSGGTGSWLAFEFFRKEQITEVVVDPNSTGSAPRSMSFQYYDTTSASWVTSWSVSSVTWATANPQTFTKP